MDKDFEQRDVWRCSIRLNVGHEEDGKNELFKEQAQCVMLSQVRLWDSQQLTRKMGKLPKHQFEAVRKAIKEMIQYPAPEGAGCPKWEFVPPL